MSRFGEYLRERGALDDAQFDEVCRSQIVHGGRIGSSLVELGYIRLDELSDHLADYHGVPLPPEEWLEAPDERALKLIPNALIRRYHVLPLRVDDDEIHVAMLDPRDSHQLNLIGSMAHRPVRAYSLPEIRLMYWLEIHCGVDRHPRYANLAARMRQSDDAASETESDFQPLAQGEALASEIDLMSDPPLAPLSPTSSPDVASPIDSLLIEEIVLLDEVVPHAEPKASRVPSGPGEIAALEAQLQGADDREAIIELALKLASAFAPCVGLFIVRSELISGHRAVADGVASSLDTVLLPAKIPSIFTQPAITNHPFRGRPPHDGMDGRILNAIGRPEAHEVLIQPVAIRGRVVNLLYADNGPDALADTLVAALRALAGTMVDAYERLILESKGADSR